MRRYTTGSADEHNCIYKEQRTVDLTVGKIAYRDGGGGSPLVFIHGMYGSSRSWRSQFEFFEQYHRTIAWDAPGFGGSGRALAPPPTLLARNNPTQSELREALEQCWLPAYADGLANWITSIGLESVVLVGHAEGGMIAAEATRRYPEIARALVLSSPFVGFGKTYKKRMMHRRRRSLIEHRLWCADVYADAAAEDAGFGFNASASRSEFRNISLDARIDGISSFGHLHYCSHIGWTLEAIRVPSLVLHGWNDIRAMRADIAEVIGWLSLHGHPPTVVPVPNAGHASYVQNASAFNQALSHFVADLDSKEDRS